MNKQWSPEHKTALTAEERIKCAYLHIIRKVQVQDLAVAFEVNTGRVSEGIDAIWEAANNPKGLVEVIATDKDVA